MHELSLGHDLPCGASGRNSNRGAKREIMAQPNHAQSANHSFSPVGTAPRRPRFPVCTSLRSGAHRCATVPSLPAAMTPPDRRQEASGDASLRHRATGSEPVVAAHLRGHKSHEKRFAPWPCSCAATTQAGENLAGTGLPSRNPYPLRQGGGFLNEN